MMKNIKFILIAFLLGLLILPDYGKAMSKDDYIELINNICDFGYDDNTRISLLNLYDVFSLDYLPYVYGSDVDGNIFLRFTDVEVFPSSNSGNYISYRYFTTLSSQSSIHYLNLYLFEDCVFYDEGETSATLFQGYTDYGASYTGQYLCNYHNVLNLYNLPNLGNFTRMPVFVDNYNTFFNDFRFYGLDKIDDCLLLSFDYFYHGIDFIRLGSNLIYDDNGYLNLSFVDFPYNINSSSSSFTVDLKYFDYNDELYFSSFDENSPEYSNLKLSIPFDVKSYAPDYIMFTYHYGDTYLYQHYLIYSSWQPYLDSLLNSDLFTDIYEDIGSELPFEENSPSDLELPFNEVTEIEKDVFDFIAFENDFKMLAEINSLDLSKVENKETALIVKFLGYELFVVRVTLSILTIALITGFAWKNFEKMFEKIKKGRSNL